MSAIVETVEEKKVIIKADRKKKCESAIDKIINYYSDSYIGRVNNDGSKSSLEKYLYNKTLTLLEVLVNEIIKDSRFDAKNLNVLLEGKTKYTKKELIDQIAEAIKTADLIKFDEIKNLKLLVKKEKKDETKEKKIVKKVKEIDENTVITTTTVGSEVSIITSSINDEDEDEYDSADDSEKDEI
jgi:hypothetical protein